MLDTSLIQRIEKLDHEKTIFAGLHRGGSSVFSDLVLHILKLKFITDQNPEELPEKLRPTKEDLSLDSSFVLRINEFEDRKMGDEKRVSILEKHKQKSYVVYRVSADFPIKVLEKFLETKNTRVFLMVRDIRDCMCSGYYAFNLLHGKGLGDPGHKRDYQSGIDQYVIDKMVPKFKYANQLIEKIESLENSRIFRYEDMILEPKSFALNLCKLLGLKKEYHEELWDLMRERFNYEEISYDKMKHKRQVFPGNYKKELTEKSISALNNTFSSYLEKNGYSL